MVLQRFEGLSDSDAVDRLHFAASLQVGVRTV
jgi:hypothetical protein